jgi:hypothetical protein
LPDTGVSFVESVDEFGRARLGVDRRTAAPSVIMDFDIATREATQAASNDSVLIS